MAICRCFSSVRALAGRARIPYEGRRPPHRRPPPSAEAPSRYGLTGRELSVLRLLAVGRTNAQIGAELSISPKTASGHVTNVSANSAYRSKPSTWPFAPAYCAIRDPKSSGQWGWVRTAST